MMQLHSHSTGRDKATAAVVAPIPALSVAALTISASAPNEAEKTVLHDVAFSVAAGEVLGVLGESGAGKSTLALSLLRLLPQGFEVRSGTIHLNGTSLLDLGDEELRSIRGNEVSLIYQDSSALNPVLRVDHQVAEVIHAHSNWSNARCLQEARATLELVGLGDDRIFSSYPHQLSGGQKQRVAIAQALACGPNLLIADEPTASLDATTALEILDLIERMRDQFHSSVLLISHQPEVLAYLSGRVVVMYAGRIIEEGWIQEVFDSPAHPYTRELLRCRTPFQDKQGPIGSKPRWPFIPGTANDFTAGCPFENRCLNRMELCAISMPPVTAIGQSHHVRCFEYAEEVS
jgi:oligopeptide/dipeptide ABC transporter ATP-binding protein